MTVRNVMESLPPEELLADELLDLLPRVLSTTAPRLVALATSIPDDLLRRRPLPGEWSPWEVLHHLLDTERLVFPPRIRAFLDGATIIQNVDQHDVQWDSTRTAAHIVEAFATLRVETLDLIATLTPGDLSRESEHSEYGPLTLGQMLHYYPAHDLTHLVQFERALIQPFLSGVGPWAGGVEDMSMR